MEHLSAIGDRLRQERARLKLTQEDLAESLAKAGVRGATRQTQSRYEKGEGPPDVTYLAHVASLGFDVLWILTGAGEAPKAAGLTAEEAVVLDYFRAASSDTRRAVMGALLGVSQLGAMQTNSGAGAVQVGTAKRKIVVRNGS